MSELGTHEGEVRICPQCSMPAYIRSGQEPHGPWPMLNNNIYLRSDIIVCQDCGWRGTWDDFKDTGEDNE